MRPNVSRMSPRRGEWIGRAVGSFGVHVDETHLHRAERSLEFTVTAVAVVIEPDVFGTPVDVLVTDEDVDAAAGEAVGLHAHGLQRQGAGEDHQVGPGDLAAVLLLDRPEQHAGLVEIDVVGPTIERREALRTGLATAATVVDAVRARAVPGHADEERTVVTEVRRPPLLG